MFSSSRAISCSNCSKKLSVDVVEKYNKIFLKIDFDQIPLLGLLDKYIKNTSKESNLFRKEISESTEISHLVICDHCDHSWLCTHCTNVSKKISKKYTSNFFNVLRYENDTQILKEIENEKKQLIDEKEIFQFQTSKKIKEIEEEKNKLISLRNKQKEEFKLLEKEIQKVNKERELLNFETKTKKVVDKPIEEFPRIMNDNWFRIRKDTSFYYVFKKYNLNLELLKLKEEHLFKYTLKTQQEILYALMCLCSFLRLNIHLKIMNKLLIHFVGLKEHEKIKNEKDFSVKFYKTIGFIYNFNVHSLDEKILEIFHLSMIRNNASSSRYTFKNIYEYTIKEKQMNK